MSSYSVCFFDGLGHAIAAVSSAMQGVVRPQDYHSAAGTCSAKMAGCDTSFTNSELACESTGHDSAGSSIYFNYNQRSPLVDCLAQQVQCNGDGSMSAMTVYVTLATVVGTIASMFLCLSLYDNYYRRNHPMPLKANAQKNYGTSSIINDPNNENEENEQDEGCDVESGARPKL